MAPQPLRGGGKPHAPAQGFRAKLFQQWREILVRMKGGLPHAGYTVPAHLSRSGAIEAIYGKDVPG